MRFASGLFFFKRRSPTGRRNTNCIRHGMRYSIALIFTLLVVVCIDFTGCHNPARDQVDTVAFPIARIVDQFGIEDPYFRRKVRIKTELLYRATALKRKWLNRRKPSALYDAFVREIRACGDYGMNPEDYHISEIEHAVDTLYKHRPETADLASLEIRITAAFFLYTTHLIEGRIRYPGAKEFLWKRGMPLENDIVLLLQMDGRKDFRNVLRRLQPADSQYERLQKALAEYRKIESEDTLAPLPTHITLKPGDNKDEVPLLRAKLAVNRDYDRSKSSDPKVYDDKLVNSVKEFQTRHGLTADGIVKGETVKWLNTPISRKIGLIALNLERMRWYPHIQNNEDQIVINVPEYMLRVYHKDKEKLSMRVVLGSEYNATPIFFDTLKYIVFSPEWMVPQSIFLKEFLPRLREDPSAYDPQRFRFYKNGAVIDPLAEDWSDKDIDSTAYSVIENPGEENSLGNVKFIMPNDFSIYLHDTPAVSLFGKQKRALSHGCIRVEKPVDLAVWLLSDHGEWNEKKIKAAMESGESEKADLKKPVPVYIIYRTAWVDNSGVVNFRDDIYGHDARQLARLKDAMNAEAM